MLSDACNIYEGGGTMWLSKHYLNGSDKLVLMTPVSHRLGLLSTSWILTLVSSSRKIIVKKTCDGRQIVSVDAEVEPQNSNN